MTNRKPTNQKSYLEFNKRIWLLKNKEGKIIDSFRSRELAKTYKKQFEKEFFEELFVERDNSYKIILKKLIK